MQKERNKLNTVKRLYDILERDEFRLSKKADTYKNVVVKNANTPYISKSHVIESR